GSERRRDLPGGAQLHPGHHAPRTVAARLADPEVPRAPVTDGEADEDRHHARPREEVQREVRVTEPGADADREPVHDLVADRRLELHEPLVGRELVPWAEGGAED